MTIFLNDEPLLLETTSGITTLSHLIAQHAVGNELAVAVNEEFVPKTDYQTRQLREGDRIELVAPMVGG